MREYLGIHNKRLITRRIPAYSPELNPDELVWDALKYQELPNFCPGGCDELCSKAETTLMKLKADPTKMKQIIKGRNFLCHQHWENNKVKKNNPGKLGNKSGSQHPFPHR